MNEKKSKLVEIKTKPTFENPADFILQIPEDQKRKDALILMELMKNASNEEPVLWSNSIIGFGIKRYKSPATGREVDWMLIGFSPRKANFSITICGNILVHSESLKKLGKHKTGVGCLYITKLEEINLDVLKVIIEKALQNHMK